MHAGTREPFQRGQKWAPNFAEALEREPAATRIKGQSRWVLPRLGLHSRCAGEANSCQNKKTRMAAHEAIRGRPGRGPGLSARTVVWFGGFVKSQIHEGERNGGRTQLFPAGTAGAHARFSQCATPAAPDPAHCLLDT